MNRIPSIYASLDNNYHELSRLANIIISRAENAMHCEHSYDEEDELDNEKFVRCLNYCHKLILIIDSISVNSALRSSIDIEYASIKTAPLETELIPYIGELEMTALDWVGRYKSIFSVILGINNNQHQNTEEFTALVRALRNAPWFVKSMKTTKKGEARLQEIYDILFPPLFPTCKIHPSVTSPLTNFRPDYGIISIKTLVELKYIDSLSDIGPCVDGICADMKNYTRSFDWERYIAVFYMTELFKTEDQIKAQFDAIKKDDRWDVIVAVESK